MTELLAPPAPGQGRVFTGTRRVRLGDVTRSGRLRLDAAARYLQDVSNDDTREAGLSDEWAWLVRRTAVRVHRYPQLGEQIDLATFCSGVGPRWAERRVQVTSDQGGDRGGDRGVLIEAATIWVHMDAESGRACKLPEEFHRIYTPTAAGRKVSARIGHAAMPGVDDPRHRDLVIRPWPQRAVDLDVLGHVNNAVSWACVEEVLATRPDPDAPIFAEVGFHLPVEPTDAVSLVSLVSSAEAGGEAGGGGNGFDLWLSSAAGVHTSAIIRQTAP
jgi:acyl-ACP thioesterase